MKYIDVVPPIVSFTASRLQNIDVVGGEITAGSLGKVVSIKLAGGAPQAAEPFTRIRLLARAETDWEATEILIEVINLLQTDFDLITDINIKNLLIDSYPVDSIDDTGQRESWCYAVVYHLEA